MTWSYADWAAQATAELRLTRLRQHVGEVSTALETRAVSVNADGKGLAREGIAQYLDTLLNQVERLERSATRANAGGISRVRLDRA